MQFPVALIVAPAGFGKTTLVTQYLSGGAGPLVRFDVRRSHATLAGFVRGFAEALETQLPALRSALRQGAAPAAGSNAPAVELADWLHAHLRDFAGLVAIDDLHVASDPEVGKLVALLVERAPRTQRWLIATRDASQLPVASWVGAGRAQMPIEESDLRFNVDEATELVAHADLAVDPGEVRAFANLMRGWPTGLALALHGSTDTENLRKIASETREFIFRYLTEQVFSELGEREQTFLLDAAVYPVVRIRWMNKAGYDDAMLLLNRLRAKIAFVERTGDDSYRLHDLFGEFLEAQLQLRGEAIFRDAVRRAAQVLKNEGESEEALVAYTRAADERGIAHLLEAEGFELIERGAQDLVGIALASLPAEIIADRPRLIACDAFLESHRGRFAAVAARFRNAIDGETDPRSRAEIGYRYAAKAFASPLADKAMQTLRSLDRKNLPVSLQASIVSLLGYYDAVSRDFPAAREQLARARDLIESVDDGALRAMI
ncbi:MAG: hypothetical protein JOZ38_05845, partial [Candidatus Eremiobacteraeota bacterium]|nr:hypothetical protein [Candidatus Eremiobacteraeota bacterium]